MRGVVLFFAFLILLRADGIDGVIENFIGTPAYKLNENFINRIFAKKESFYLQEGQPDYFKIARVLKENGLMVLGFREPAEILIGFKAQTKPIFLTRAINSLLSSIGYSYFTIARAKYTQGDVYLTFSLVSEHGVDPVIVLSELKRRGIIATKVAREGKTNWLYELKVVDSSIVDAIALKYAERSEFKNISGEYWFSVDGSGVLSILKKQTKIGWSPRIVLYDKNLQILEILTQKEFSASVEVNVSEKVAFIMVTDLNNPSRLKSGITVVFNTFGDS